MGIYRFRQRDNFVSCCRITLSLYSDPGLEGKSNIFVATDEPEFLDFMTNRFGSERVIDLDCQEIYSGRAPHSTPGDPAVKASEAIRSILTLARCGLLIRTRSHLSAWAKILSPSLPTIVLGDMLSSDQIGFPENRIQTELHPCGS